MVKFMASVDVNLSSTSSSARSSSRCDFLLTPPLGTIASFSSDQRISEGGTLPSLLSPPPSSAASASSASASSALSPTAISADTDDSPLQSTLLLPIKVPEPSSIPSIPSPSCHFAPGIVRQQARMTYEGANAGGPMFNAKLNSWCTYHTISKCGEVANEKGQDLQLLCPDRLRQSDGQLRDAESVDREYIINAAGQLGRAAGKLYIATIASTNIQTFSGFWLDNIYFVTCCHWEEFPDLSRTTAMYQEMICPTSQRAIVSSADKSLDPDPDVDVRVYLVNLHKSGDIAIFKRHEEFSTDPPLSVRLDQLHISNTDKQEPIFTTGYCGSDFFLHPRGRATRFDHLLQNYKNSCSQHLKTLPENLRIGQLRLQTTVSEVTFDRIFAANARALAVGRTVPSTDSVDKMTEPMFKEDSFVIEYMTISGFDSLSGSMISHFSNDDPTRPGVIGIFIGQSETHPLHRFVRFKENGVAWIKGTVMKDRASTATMQ